MHMQNRVELLSTAAKLFVCRLRAQKHGHPVADTVWQSPSKEEDHYTFRTIPREHWLIGSVHGTRPS